MGTVGRPDRARLERSDGVPPKRVCLDGSINWSEQDRQWDIRVNLLPGSEIGSFEDARGSLRLFLRSGKDGTKSSTASSGGSKLATTQARTTLSASTSTSPSYSIPQTPVELWSTASDSPERWLGPGLANQDPTIFPNEILSNLSPDGATITPRRRRRLGKTILPLNLEKLLGSTETNSSRREDAEK